MAVALIVFPLPGTAHRSLQVLVHVKFHAVPVQSSLLPAVLCSATCAAPNLLWHEGSLARRWLSESVPAR